MPADLWWPAALADRSTPRKEPQAACSGDLGLSRKYPPGRRV